MISSWIITLILVLALIFIIIKIVKVFLKAVIVITILLVIASLIFGVLIHNDAVKLTSDLNGRNLILLSKSLPSYSSILTGFETKPDDETAFKVLNSENISSILKSIRDKKLDELRKKNNISRVFFINESLLKSGITFKGFKLTREQCIKILNSEDPISELLTNSGNMSDESVVASELRNEVTNEELKATVFALMFKEDIRKNPFTLFEGYKSGEVSVIPETIIFKTLKIMPIKPIENFIKNKMSKNNSQDQVSK